MNTNKKTFFALIIALIVLTSFVYALQESNGNIILGIWYNHDSSATSATITNGDEIRFNVYALAVGSSLNVDVDLIKQDGSITHIQHFNRGYQNYNEFGIGSEGDYVIGNSVYGVPGNHKIRLTVTGTQTDSLELNLNVVAQPPEPQNNVPTITSSPVITVIENQAYSYDVDATDPEGQTLTYSLTAYPTSWPSFSINSSTGLITATAPNVTANTPYSVIVSVTDGTNSASQSFDIIVLDLDTTAPTVTITFPSNIEYDSQITQLTYTATDANLDECWFSPDLGNTNLLIGTCSGSFSINSVEGINRWTVYASDLFGNIGSDLITFRVDTSDEDDDDSDSTSKKVTYVYEDPDKDKYTSQVTGTGNMIDLTTPKIPQKGFFTRLIEAIINFFRWLFS